jgi:hypothetical protein
MACNGYIPVRSPVYVLPLPLSQEQSANIGLQAVVTMSRQTAHTGPPQEVPLPSSPVGSVATRLPLPTSTWALATMAPTAALPI